MVWSTDELANPDPAPDPPKLRTKKRRAFNLSNLSYSRLALSKSKWCGIGSVILNFFNGSTSTLPATHIYLLRLSGLDVMSLSLSTSLICIKI